MRGILNKKVCCIFLVCTMVLCLVAGDFILKSQLSKADKKPLTAKERLMNLRNETMANGNFSINLNGSEKEVVRAIVTLDAKSVSESSNASNYTSKLKSKEKKIVKEQRSIIKKVEKMTGNKVVNQTAYLVNSFSIDATRKQIKKIAKLEGVDKVYEASTYKPCMNKAVDFTGVKSVWESKDYGYTGEGVIVAIIDSGVNYKHQDMILDKGAKTKFTKEEWKKKIELLGYGNYFTEKVPFGYDYSCDNKDCLDVNDATGYHGYHVSGIVAGNGDDIDGVARNAQLLGMKVFGHTGAGATSDFIVRSIEDAVKLGADIINMSLGSSAGVVSDEDYIQEAVEMAADEGVLSCIAAGNDGTSTGLNDDTNLMNTKDTAIVGSPAIAESSLAVASVDNVADVCMFNSKIKLGEEEVDVQYMDIVGEGFNFSDTELINVGVAVDENRKQTFTKNEVKGKIAVAKVGTSTIDDKIYKLSKAEVKGIVLVDENDEINKDITCYNWYGVPVVVVNKISGAIIIEAADIHATYTTISKEENQTVDKVMTMSSFSSWGSTNELGIKPEIAAPGGNIKAAYNGVDNYGVLSGTSMATPFTAGSQAIMLNAIKERGLELKGKELVEFMKNSLMNTADYITDVEENAPYSVRHQGAGLVDVYGAVNNNVLVTCKDKPKVELGELTDGVTFELELKNYGEVDAKYKISDTPVYTDYTLNTKNEDGSVIGRYGLKVVDTAKITYDTEEIVVPAKGTTKVVATLSLPSDYNMNSYIESFIVFSGQEVQNIGLPVLGFYGDWEAERIISKTVYEDDVIDENTENYSEKLDELTALASGNYGEGPQTVLGLEVVKNQVTEGVDINKKIIGKKYQDVNSKEYRNLVKSIETKGMLDGVTPDKDKAIFVKIGESVKAPIVNRGDYVLYKIKATNDIGCMVEMDPSIYPGITLYDKNMNMITSNEVGYMAGTGYMPLEFSLNKGETVYVEVSSLMGQVGFYNVDFVKKEYTEENSILAMQQSSDSMIKNIEMQENQEIEFNYEEAEFICANFKVKEDGYYTFDFDLEENIDITLNEMIYENDQLKEINSILQISDCGKFSREFKLKKDASYSFDFTQEGHIVDAKVSHKVKYYKSEGTNIYALERKYNADKVSFSPNDDGLMDTVIPMLTQYRCAKEIDVKVLDSDKNVIRKIGSNLDEGKISYLYAKYYEENPKILGDCSEDGIVNWDGKVYNKSTGEYELVKEGQYYIQIDAKLTKNSLPQVVTMPVKIDNTKPEVTDFKCREYNGDKIIEFKATDSLGLNPYFYIDMEYNEQNDGQEGCVVNTSAKLYSETYVNTEGYYEINMGDINVDKITLMVEDMAGNTVTKKCFGEDIDEVDADLSENDSEIVAAETEPEIKLIKNDSMKKVNTYISDNKEVVLLDAKQDDKFTFQVKVLKDNEGLEPNEESQLLVGAYDVNTYDSINSTSEYVGDGMYNITVDYVKGAIGFGIGYSDPSILYGYKVIEMYTDETTFIKSCSAYDSSFIFNEFGENFSMVIDDTMINEDGTYTLTGVLGAVPDRFTINSDDVYVNPKTKEFTYDLKVKKGTTCIKVEFSINGQDYIYTNELHYDNVEVTINGIDSDKLNEVIYSESDIFNLAGAIKSYTSVAMICVNGDTVYNASDFLMSRDDRVLSKKFDYNIKLDKGENKISFVITTCVGIEKTIDITVVH